MKEMPHPDPDGQTLPPSAVRRFLEHFLTPEERIDILGDMEEEFRYRVSVVGRRRARGANQLDVLFALLPFMWRSITWTSLMWINYLTTAFRLFWRHRAQASINVAGLAIGLVTAFFILMWVEDELAYDRYHDDSDRIYRVMQNVSFGAGAIETVEAVPMPLDAVFEAQFPEIENSVLFSNEQSWALSTGDATFREGGYFVDPDYFDVFTYEFLAGEPTSALQSPEAIVLTEDLAVRHFGQEWRRSILGKTLSVDESTELTVTGVIANLPAQSSYRFDAVRPMYSFLQGKDWLEDWRNSNLRLFLRLEPGADAALVAPKILDLVVERTEDNSRTIQLQPYSDVYLRSNFVDGVAVGGRIEYVRIFGWVGLFVLLIAIINFMNLATARSTQRGREIGVRKALGASRLSLMQQFLGESMMTSLAALSLALLLAFLLLPSFNALTGKVLALNLLDPGRASKFGAITLIAGLMGGLYPAFVLSSFSATAVLRDRVTGFGGGARVRKILVVSQFALSTILILGTLTVYNQIGYLRETHLGADRENLITAELDGVLAEKYETFKAYLSGEPGVASVSFGSGSPLLQNTRTPSLRWDGKAEDDGTGFRLAWVGHDYVETAGIKLDEGRTHSAEFLNDASNFVINQQAALAMGMEQPLGQELSLWGSTGVIIGVVQDYHLASLYSPIDPLVLILADEAEGQLLVRAKAGRTQEAIASLKRAHASIVPGVDMEYEFLDEEWARMYRSELVTGTLANYFAGLAIFIACLGLFGLAAFTAQRRTREIGIRKAMGASVPGVVMLLSREFILLVALALLIGVPVAWYLVDGWLGSFEYHTTLGFGSIALVALAAVGLAFLTVSIHSVRAARANPVDTLRCE